MGDTTSDNSSDGGLAAERDSAQPVIASSARSSILVGAGIALSRASGIVREVVLSALLGATTAAAEAFAFALQLPKMLQNLLGEGALSASFIPVYSQLVDDDRRQARSTAGAVFGLLAAAVGAVVLILMVAARPIVSLLARVASDERRELMADLLQIIAPGIGFIVFAAWCLGILNAHRDFFLSYVAPVIWNAAIVLSLLIWRTNTDSLASLATAAAWGVFIGGVAQFAVQMPRVLRTAGPITPSLDHAATSTREVLRRFVPGVAGRGVVTLGAALDSVLALLLAVGALSVLARAQTLLLLPISLFAVSIAAAELPELSRAGASTVAVFGERVRVATERVLFFLVFSAIAFIVGGRALVGLLFERGEFTADDTTVVWLVLAVFSLGLVASGMSRLLQNAAFATGDVAGPARIAATRLGVAVVIGALLMFPADRWSVVDGAFQRSGDGLFGPLADDLLEQERSHRLGALGLATGSAVGAWLEFGLLRRRFSRTGASLPLAPSLRSLAPSAGAACIVCGGLAWATRPLPHLLAAGVTIGLSGIVYVTVANARRVATAGELIATVRRVAQR